MISFFTLYGFVFEILLSFFLFTYFLRRRRFFWLRAAGVVAVLFLYGFLRNLIPQYNVFTEILKYVALYFLCFGCLCFLFRAPVKSLLFSTVAASLTQHCAYKAGNLLMYLLPGLDTIALGALYVFIVLAVNFLCWLILGRHIGREDDFDRLPRNSVLYLSAAILLICVVFQQIFEQVGETAGTAMTVLFAASDIVTCFFVIIMQYEILTGNRLRRENDRIEGILTLQEKQMQESKETIDLINIKCHDLKQQIAHLGNRNNIDSGEIEEISRAVMIYDRNIRTGNEILDVLLAEKRLSAESRGVIINCMADAVPLSFMRASDIYSLFGNAIDNAVEAAAKVSDSEKKFIGVNIKQSRGMMSAHIENFYEGELILNEDGFPVTTKEEERGYHGFGIKSIRYIAKKYHGYVSISASDGRFCLDVLLPLEREDAVQNVS